MKNKKLKLKELELKKQKLILKAQNDFWYYLKTKDIYLKNGKKLYSEKNTYLKELAYKLQDLIDGKMKTEDGEEFLGICISMPPRHAKSLTVKFFTEWLIGRNNDMRVGYISYSQDLVNQFSRDVRNNIQNPAGKISFNEIFGDVKISKDKKSVKEWYVENKRGMFKTGSFRTALTGSGFDIIIIDDPIKNSEEALNDKAKEDKWNLFTDTILSRTEGSKIIIIQTRWAKDDFVGRIKESELSHKFYYLELKALLDEEKKIMLNEDILSYSEYEDKRKMISPLIFEANYNQIQIDDAMALYKNWKKWDSLPKKPFERVGALDPALGGGDYTSLVYGNFYKDINKIYLQDIYYKNVNITSVENDVINFIIKNDLDELVIESNGAFIILSNNIEKELRKRGHKCKIITFKQTKNKETRIITLANLVQESILFMNNFEDYKEVYKHFTNFKMNFKDNKNDDFEDSLTLLYEKYLYKENKNRMEIWEDRLFI